METKSAVDNISHAQRMGMRMRMRMGLALIYKLSAMAGWKLQNTDYYYYYGGMRIISFQ